MPLVTSEIACPESRVKYRRFQFIICVIYLNFLYFLTCMINFIVSAAVFRVIWSPQKKDRRCPVCHAARHWISPRNSAAILRFGGTRKQSRT
jgi:hypothetical protein